MKNTTKNKLLLSFLAALIGMPILLATVELMLLLFVYSIKAAFAFVFVFGFLYLWLDAYKYINKDEE